MKLTQAIVKTAARMHDQGTTRGLIGWVASALVLHYLGWQVWGLILAAIGLGILLLASALVYLRWRFGD